MSDQGKFKESGSHVGTEHLCRFGGIVTFDNGRFYACPLDCGFTIADTGEYLLMLSEDEKAYIAELYQRALNSIVLMQRFDVDALGWKRLFDYMDSLANKYRFDPDSVIIKPDGKLFQLPNKRDTRP